ncbi:MULTISPECIES: hypothetical protein [unclassified Agrobacterium]|uniref:hypothetical protein n=1 Tax=unclassified Agrobacterium TaxID=2632611 RepID=UPI00244B7788|nr:MULTISPECIES: hypothetical protein [unclassified Agrobacterium]MDH0614926.1 hypothetical protein [Agrobacterium sp. GD03872]MDH0699530.1 hypothetical protein [Agrobacterium sp. GD03871]MDH1061988.1 hypothetical protein [Agrobacterium sp. GD03992]MDH2211696.1 hypothetical protein [Agrobacterium sp. GD03643]MDH2220388.1 hypothetical protein [Agrobacterium sp. GD03638]
MIDFDGDLPPNFHPAATRASVVFECAKMTWCEQPVETSDVQPEMAVAICLFSDGAAGMTKIEEQALVQRLVAHGQLKDSTKPFGIGLLGAM